jgi:hypothetical protein
MARSQKEIDKIFEKAKEVIAKHNLIFIEEIVSFLPISKPTFYEYFPIDSNEINELKSLLEDNAVSTKAKLRTKWYESDNPTLQIALYRLTSRDDEHKKLNQSYIDHTSKNEKIDNRFEIEIISNQNEVSPEETN